MADTTDKSTTEKTDESRIQIATQLTVAWLSNPNVNASAEDVPAFLRNIHATIGELANPAEVDATPSVEHVPAVSVRASIKPDFLISLIDGKKLKSLKRHLASHGLTPQQYRERFGLRPDYPMVAASYSERRREVAKKLGLGRVMRRGAAAATPAPAAAATPAPSAKPTAAAKPKAKAAPKAAPKAAAKDAAAQPKKRATARPKKTAAKPSAA